MKRSQCHTHDCPRARHFLRSASPHVHRHLAFHTHLGLFPGWVKGSRVSRPGASQPAQLCASKHLIQVLPQELSLP